MLKAGFARLDVTPPLGTFIPGAGIQRFSEKVLDPIFLNALAISLDGETVIIVAADFLAIGMQYANELRDVIAKRTGVPVKNIMIHALYPVRLERQSGVPRPLYPNLLQHQRLRGVPCDHGGVLGGWL